MESDIDFWLRNFKEHLIFLMEHLNGKLLKEVRYLYDNYSKYEIVDLVEIIGTLKFKLYDLTLAGKTSIPKGLIGHQIEEYDYFILKFSDEEIIPSEEFKFWNQNDMEHLQINLKHFDESDIKNISLCNRLIESFRNLDEYDINFMRRSIEIAILTDKFHKSIRNSSISRLLLSHIIEEGQRGIIIRSKILDL